MGRIDLIGPDEATDDVRAVYRVLEERFHKVPNLFAAVAHHPAALEPLLQLFGSVYEETDLSPRVVELAIIKVSFALQSHYCLTLHKAFALERGVTDAELRSLVEDPSHAAFPEAERAVLDFAAVYAVDAREISDESCARLREHYSQDQVVTLCLLMSLSRLFGDVANTLQIPLDAFIKPPA